MEIGDICCRDAIILLVSASEPSSAIIISAGRWICLNTESMDSSSASFQLKVVMISEIFKMIRCVQ